MRRSGVVVLALTVAPAVAGCGSGATNSAESTTTVTATTTATATVTITATPDNTDSSSATDEVDTDPSVEEFGETIEFANGLTISISRPQPFEPSAQADYDGYPLPKKGVPVMFTVTEVNTGNKALSRDLEFIDVTSGGRPTQQEVGLNDPKYSLQALPLDTPIPAGQKSLYEMGYFVADPNDLAITFTGNNLDPVTFVSSE